MDKGPARFQTTQWSVIRRLGEGNADEVEAILEDFGRTYWYPLYAFLRRQGHDEHDAADLVQGFFRILLERKSLESIDEEGGRFRSFLLKALRNHVAQVAEAASAQKRGGGRDLVALDAELAENLYRSTEARSDDPERELVIDWARALISVVDDRLRTEMELRGRAHIFDELRPHLTGAIRGELQVELSRRLGVETSHLRVTLHRLRQRFGALVRAEIEATVSTRAEVDAELDALIEALHGAA